MKDSATYRAETTDRGGEVVVVDADSGERLVVVGPSFGHATKSQARWHTPDPDALPAVEPGCDSDSSIGEGESWGLRVLDALDDRVEQCAYCSGDADRAEHSALGGQAKDNYASRLRAMDPAEFDRRAGIEMPDSAGEQA